MSKRQTTPNESEFKDPLSTGPSASFATATWFLVASLFVFCIGPTFISYQSYRFGWDESDYFARSIAASRAFWSGDSKALGAAMVSIRPPMMTFMGLPWGPLKTWNDAGNCFITLGASIALMAAITFYLVLRIGIKPVFLIAACICIWLSLGPVPPRSLAHACSTGFLADILFSWICLSAVLLIPLESRTSLSNVHSDLMRGILWGLILAAGTITKLNFLYFIALIVPVLIAIRWWRQGSDSAIRASIALSICSAPAVFYLLRYGRLAFANLRASSFGSIAGFYNKPLLVFLRATVADAPGMAVSFGLVGTALIYLTFKHRERGRWSDLLALAIMIGFAIIVFGATNKQIRYAFPAVVSLPVLSGLLLSNNTPPLPRKPAAVAAGLTFCVLLAASIPMRYRPDAQSLARCNNVLAAADRWSARQILLATDSPNLNSQLMELAALFTPKDVSVGTLAYQAMYDQPIADDFRTIDSADLIVFQDRFRGSPQFTNQRVADYEIYAKRLGAIPARIADDIYVYRLHKQNLATPNDRDVYPVSRTDSNPVLRQ